MARWPTRPPWAAPRPPATGTAASTTPPAAPPPTRPARSISRISASANARTSRSGLGARLRVERREAGHHLGALGAVGGIERGVFPHRVLHPQVGALGEQQLHHRAAAVGGGVDE